MNRGLLLGMALLALPAPAFAHAIAGSRLFPVTLSIDDPGVADELSFPTLSWQRSGAGDESGPTHQTDLTFEFSKRLTSRLGISVGNGFSILQTGHSTRTGWGNLEVGAKYQAYVNAEHEFLLSLGVVREFGGTGTTHLGAEATSSTTPTLYFGKGLGDLPIGYLRPFAITGVGAYTVADERLKQVQGNGTGAGAEAPEGGPLPILLNNGQTNRWSGGISVQYSLPYLQSQVRDLHLPEAIGRLVPLVEIAASSPASRPSNLPTQLIYAPGVIYMGDWFQLGLEALIPGNRASGSNVGVIAQFHVFFDDLLPRSLGRPVFE